ELAVDEARQHGDDHVGAQHLLIALGREGEETAGGPVYALGLRADQLRALIIDIARTSRERAEPGVPPQARIGIETNPPPTAGAERFDKFTPGGRRVLQLAQEEAQRFNHNYIGTEHLLLGLAREGQGVADTVLLSLGIDLNKVRNAIEFIIGRGERTVTGDIGLTPRAKKIIELSVEEAGRLQHDYVGTEHLLLGLVREGEALAAGASERLAVR